MIPLTKAPYVTLQKRGTISFNKSAHVALGAPQAIELMYDANEQVIGFRSVDPKAEHAYPIRETNNGTSYVVSGRAFVGHYGINTDVSRRYPATIVDGILCLDLKTPGTVVTSTKKASSTYSKKALGDALIEPMSSSELAAKVRSLTDGSGEMFKGTEESLR
jgi:hypothetical protein